MSDLNRKKILSLHWGFSLGGVAKYAELLEQVGRYHDIKVKSVCICGKDWDVDSNTMSNLDFYPLYINSKLDFSWVKKLKTIIDDEAPDAVMTHGFNGHLIYRWVTLFSAKKVIWIASYHGEYHGNSLLRRAAGKLFNSLTVRLFKKQVDRIISVASYSKQHLVKQGVDGNKIDVIHNGIDVLDVDTLGGKALRQEWGVKDDEIVFGVVSRLDPVKGIEYLIDAFSNIYEQFPKVKFIVIGSGSITSQLENRVIDNGISDVVHFAGYRSDVVNCLAALDIFVLPSLAEYHSIALLEAMRAEKPIISTDVGGNTESVRNGKEAIVVSPADVDALSEALIEMLSNSELRGELAKNARSRFVNDFTSDTMIEKTSDWIYETMVMNENS